MEKMMCPICGKKFNILDARLMDNGNPICPNCEDENDELEQLKQNEEKTSSKSK